LRGQYAAGDARGVAAILCAVTDPIIEVALRIDECDVSRDAAGGSPVHGSDEEVVTQADDPDRGWFPQRAIRSDGRDPQFV